MSTAIGQCSLFICPRQHDFTIEDSSTLIAQLQKIGFISNKINTDETGLQYFTGDHYLKYISYMGCAPAIQFEPSETTPDFCFIEIHCYDPAKLICSKKQTRAPHCPVCSKAVKEWQQHSNSTAISCNACNTESGIETFDWRKMAGYAQLFIEITDIFPKEAIPQQLLLDKLAGFTGIEWQHFYSCQ